MYDKSVTLEGCPLSSEVEVVKKRLVVLGLVLAFGATGAIADTRQHYATASTKKEARLLATAEARQIARTSALCFRPAYQVAECQKVDGGFRCRADTSANARVCGHAGWLREADGRALPTRTTWWTDPWPMYASGPYPLISRSYISLGYTPPPPGWQPAQQPVLPPLFPAN